MGVIESIRGVMWARRNQPDEVAYMLGASHERFGPGELLRQAVLAERGGLRRDRRQRPPDALVGARRPGAGALRQRLGVARRGRPGDQGIVLGTGVTASSTATTRWSWPSRSPRSRPAPGPRVPRGGLERGDERGAGGDGLARHRRAARPHRGGADHHRPPARRRDGHLRRASTSAPAGRASTCCPSAARRSYMSAFHEQTAEVAGRLADGVWTLANPLTAPEVIAAYRRGAEAGRARARARSSSRPSPRSPTPTRRRWTGRGSGSRASAGPLHRRHPHHRRHPEPRQRGLRRRLHEGEPRVGRPRVARRQARADRRARGDARSWWSTPRERTRRA